MKRRRDERNRISDLRPVIKVAAATELGVCKVAEIDSSNLSASIVNTWGQPNKKQRFTGISGTASTKSETGGSICVLQRSNGCVEIRDTTNGQIIGSFQVVLEEEAPVQTSLIYHNALVERSPGILICQSNGCVTIHEQEETPSGEEGTQSWKGVKQWRGPKNVNAIAIDDSEQFIAFACTGSEMSVWNLDTGKQIYLAKAPKPDRIGLVEKPRLSAVCFIPGKESKQILVGTETHKLRLYETSQRRPKLVVNFEDGKIMALAPDPEGGKVWVADSRGKIAYLDLIAGSMHKKLQGPTGSIRSLKIHPNRNIIASAGLDQFLYLHDTNTGKLLARTFLKQAAVGLIFCPDQEKRTQNADDEQNLKSKLESEENGQESDLPLPPPPLQGRKSVKQKDNHIILGKRLKGT